MPVQQQDPTAEIPTASVHTPSVQEVENDPLVRTVLDIFDGEIIRVHPKNT